MQRRRAVFRERLDDRIVVGERVWSLEGPLSPDRIGDLGCRARIAIAVEDLGEKTSDGGSEPYAYDPHDLDAIDSQAVHARGVREDRCRDLGRRSRGGPVETLVRAQRCDCWSEKARLRDCAAP